MGSSSHNHRNREEAGPSTSLRTMDGALGTCDTEMRIEMRRVLNCVVFSALLGCVLVLAIVMVCHRPDPKGVVRRAMFETVGTNAIDCGWSAIGDDRSKQSDCVFDSFRNRKPFVVLYEVQGKEAPYEVGLAGNQLGTIYKLGIESGDGFQKIYREATKGEKHITPTACPTPIDLRVVADGYVLCFSK